MDIYSHRDGSRECRPIVVPPLDADAVMQLEEATAGARIPVLTPGLALELRPVGSAVLDAAHTYILPLNRLAEEVHAANVEAGWWTDLATGMRKDRNVGEMLMLVASEIAEADEGVRGDLMDDKLPHRLMLEVELADAKIRILDIAGSRQFDLSGAAHDLIVVAGMVPDVWYGVHGALMRIVCDVARAMEGHRKDSTDRELPVRSGFEVGLAAALLRIHWLGEMLGLDIDGAVEEKRAFNRVRPDHKAEIRQAAGGKAY